MALTIKEFEINELKTRIGKSIHRMKIVNFYYGDDFRKVPNIRAYGGMHVMKGKFGNYFELDLKDDDTEKFFKILGEQCRYSISMPSPITWKSIWLSCWAII